MDREIKGAVIPWLRTQGFKGSFPHLRRTGQSAIDLLTFQFDLHRGGYVIEIAQCPLELGMCTPRAASASKLTTRRAQLNGSDMTSIRRARSLRSH
jgi:hypothetical protein